LRGRGSGSEVGVDAAGITGGEDDEVMDVAVDADCIAGVEEDEKEETEAELFLGMGGRAEGAGFRV